MTLISIITPTYNRASLLPRMIRSVIRQTFTNWELIIVDDGSGDNTRTIIEGFQDPRIKYFYKQNSGAADTRNIGVKKSSGDYIIFLDSDDEAKANWLQKMVEQMLEQNTTVACCGLEKHDPDDRIVEIRLPKDLGSIFNNTIGNFLSGTLLMKKSYFLDSGGYDVELSSGQHTEILMRLLPIFEKEQIIITNIFEPLVIIHLHTGDRIRHNFDAIYRGSTRTLKKHEQLFLENKDKYYDYLSVAARCAFKTNRIKEGKELTWRAFKLKPFNFISIARLLRGFAPNLIKKSSA